MRFRSKTFVSKGTFLVKKVNNLFQEIMHLKSDEGKITNNLKILIVESWCTTKIFHDFKRV